MVLGIMVNRSLRDYLIHFTKEQLKSYFTEHMILCELCNTKPAKYLLDSLQFSCCLMGNKCRRSIPPSLLCAFCDNPATMKVKGGAICSLKCPAYRKFISDRAVEARKVWAIPEKKDQFLEKRRQTIMKRYGVSSTSSLTSVKEKISLAVKIKQDHLSPEAQSRIFQSRKNKKTKARKQPEGVTNTLNQEEILRISKLSIRHQRQELISLNVPCGICKKNRGLYILPLSKVVCCERRATLCKGEPTEGDKCYGCGEPARRKTKSGFVCGSHHFTGCLAIAEKQFIREGKPKEEWLQKKWGSLVLDPDQQLIPMWPDHSKRKFRFLCDCGRVTRVSFSNVNGGDTHSCGHCNDKSKGFWLEQRWGKLRLDPNQNLPSEWSKGVDKRIQFLCDCGKSKPIIFRNVTREVDSVSSCGCEIRGQGEFSPENEVRKYLSEILPCGSVHPTAYQIAGTKKSFDVYVPSKKLAIEYHGLIWHSEKFKGETIDYTKLQVARSRGDRLIQIYSDEWRDKKEIMKEMLKSLVQTRGGKRIKPIYEVHYKTPLEARTFLDQHHYLGSAGGCLTIIAKHGEAIVGVWVFMKREDGVILWHRACWHPAYKAWNPHEKALKLALPELKLLGFTKMITFSDNRFHTGQLYEKLGFTFETEIPPNYYYTDGVERKSKYVFRVPAGTHEVKAAADKGWYRIWDSGKRRYSMSVT